MRFFTPASQREEMKRWAPRHANKWNQAAKGTRVPSNCHSGIILGINLGSLWIFLVVTLWSPWGHSEGTFGPLWDHRETTLGSLWNPFVTILWPLWVEFGASFKGFLLFNSGLLKRPPSRGREVGDIAQKWDKSGGSVAPTCSSPYRASRSFGHTRSLFAPTCSMPNAQAR